MIEAIAIESEIIEAISVMSDSAIEALSIESSIIEAVEQL